jgi:hypothetical protein
MTVNIPKIDPDEIRRICPLEVNDPPAGTFELALALAGTVSAGTYTAGVLDFLLEALDAWQAEKDKKTPGVPTHNVFIRAIAGASGGAINGILFGRSAEYGSNRGATKGNPLYDAWTAITMPDLLEISQTQPFNAFLNASKIEKMAEDQTKLVGKTPSPNRPYLTNPLRIYATVTNITGVPYNIPMSGQTGLSHSMSRMEDWVRLAAPISTGTGDTLREYSTVDEFFLDRTQPGGWAPAYDACLATSAFPGAFPSRNINREAVALGYRFLCIAKTDGTGSEVAQITPNWDLVTPNFPNPRSVKTLNVDGGACNNEPLDLARRVLAGYSGRNERAGDKANRATILVDPFSDRDPLGPIEQPKDPIAPILTLIFGLVSQARFKAEDLVLAQREDVFSRFLIAPIGQGKTGITPNSVATTGAAAIASGAFGGFSGFLNRRYLDYDFKLGRRNAYVFLTKHFMLPVGNPLVQAPWWPAAAPDWQDVDKTGAKFRAIIPIMKTVTPPDDPGILPKITKGELDVIFDAAKDRLDWIFEGIKNMLVSKPGFLNALGRTYLNLGWLATKGSVRSAIRDRVEKGLAERGLF